MADDSTSAPQTLTDNADVTSVASSVASSMKAAAAIASSWLAVQLDPENPDVESPWLRFGPFETREEAEDYASERFDLEYEIVPMMDVSKFEEIMGRHLVATDERFNYEKAMESR